MCTNPISNKPEQLFPATKGDTIESHLDSIAWWDEGKRGTHRRLKGTI